MSEPTTRDELFAQIHAAHPRLRDALVADALIALRHRGEGEGFRSRLDTVVQIGRLAWCSDAFLGQALYRAKARMQALGIPFLPRVAQRLANLMAQIYIGDPVIIEAGVYIVHGSVVIDGITTVRAGAVIAPFSTIGLIAGNFTGPTLDRDVSVGAGAKILGAVTVGAGATVGANAVVINDVEPGATVVGLPARPVVT